MKIISIINFKPNSHNEEKYRDVAHVNCELDSNHKGTGTMEISISNITQDELSQMFINVLKCCNERLPEGN